jgi:hypothetical protein
VTAVVRVEEIGSERVAPAMALAPLFVENDPHGFKGLEVAQQGVKTIGKVLRERSPGVYSSTVPSTSE